MENSQELKIKEIQAKRVDIVRINCVKESSMPYKNSRMVVIIRSQTQIKFGS